VKTPKTKTRTRRSGDLGDQVYRRLKELILEYEFRPGERLISQEIAERFEVSRTPVNHALTRLEREGMVTWRPNRGYQIGEIDADEARELFELREALEAFAVERAAARRTSEALRELRWHLAEYARLGTQPLSRQKLLLDRGFHMKIAEMAGNARLQETLGQVFERLILKRRIEGLPSRGKMTVDEHAQIFEAIAAGKPALAVRRMRQHVEHSRTNLLNHLEGKRALFPDTADRRRRP
jgi:DNA-binding GntR family transcriptional regulator